MGEIINPSAAFGAFVATVLVQAVMNLDTAASLRVLHAWAHELAEHVRFRQPPPLVRTPRGRRP